MCKPCAAREQIEERAAGIGGHEDTRRLFNCTPRERLAQQKQHAQHRAGGPIAVEFAAPAGFERPPRQFQQRGC